MFKFVDFRLISIPASHEFMKELILPKFADSLCEFGFDGGLLYF